METECRAIIQRCGEENQLNIAIEEMSELTKCITKYFRYPVKDLHYDHIKEELADVLIMAKQVQIIFSIPEEELKTEIRFKLERTEKRLETD